MLSFPPPHLALPPFSPTTYPYTHRPTYIFCFLHQQTPWPCKGQVQRSEATLPGSYWAWVCLPHASQTSQTIPNQKLPLLMYFCLHRWGEVAVRLWQALVLPSPPSAPPQIELRTNVCQTETNFLLQGQMVFGPHPAWELLSLSLHYILSSVLECVCACVHMGVHLPFRVEKRIWYKYAHNSMRDLMWRNMERMDVGPCGVHGWNEDAYVCICVCIDVFLSSILQKAIEGCLENDICRNAYLTTDMNWGGRNFWFAWFLCRMNFGCKTERKLSYTSEEASKLSPLKCPVLGLQQISRIWPPSRNWLFPGNSLD